MTPNNYKDPFTEWLESQKNQVKEYFHKDASFLLDRIIAKYREQSSWIPVTPDTMPQKAGYYTCWCNSGPEGGEPGLIHYHPETGWQNGFYNDVVTHYQNIVPPINKEQ